MNKEDNVTLDDIVLLIARTQVYTLLGFMDMYGVLHIEAQKSKRQDLVEYYKRRLDIFSSFAKELEGIGDEVTDDE